MPSRGYKAVKEENMNEKKTQMHILKYNIPAVMQN